MISITLLLFVLLVSSWIINGEILIEPLTKQRAGVLKAILPFGIILHHISINSNLLPDFIRTGPYIVAIFFALSGYGIEYKRQSLEWGMPREGGLTY